MTQIPCPCEYTDPNIDRWTADWHRAHRAHHLAVFPTVDAVTRRNLDEFVVSAASREAVAR